MNLIQRMEAELVDEFKELVSDEPGKNFVKPISEFWKDCKPEDTAAYGTYGIWFGTEGGTLMKDGQYPCEYYNGYIHPAIQDFLDKYKDTIYLEWYDPATVLITINK